MEICGILYKHKADSKKLLDALRVHFEKTAAYDKVSCACSIAGILPVTRVETDNIPQYKELVKSMLKFLKDVDFFAVALHYFRLIDLASSSTLIAEILSMLQQKSGMLKLYPFFSKQLPAAVLRIYRPCKPAAKEAYLRCVHSLVHSELLSAQEVRSAVPREELAGLSELDGEEEVKELSGGESSGEFVGSNCADEKDSFDLKTRPGEEGKNVKVFQPTLKLHKMFESYNENFDSISKFLKSAEEILLRPFDNKMPQFQLLTFLPVKYMLSQCIAIVIVDPENVVYTILSKIQYLLTDTDTELDKNYNCSIKVMNYQQPDIREKYWMPYVIFKTKRAATRSSIQFYVNDHVLRYGGMLIEKYLSINARVETVCVYVYLWALKRGFINGDGGFFTAYGLYLLVIFFLQIVEPPVVCSLQKYAEENIEPHTNKEIIDMKTLKSTPTYNDYKYYTTDILRFHAFNDSFLKIEVDKLPFVSKNTGSSAQLIAKFFHYFSAEYSKVPRDLKMSVREGKYIPAANHKANYRFAFNMEDPILPSFNPLNSVLYKSSGFSEIVAEFKKGYEVLLEYEKSDSNIPFCLINHTCMLLPSPYQVT
eukprot:TRINITY_DN3191_c0_g1_i7.p1 TRINITY_DN3191_c0_g1~~TRINITY_DN3191_c0_g1_i7.p1  ORF type:complete len:594 (-),score=108.27 TRINITY_DN3191_c0_g1_i7:43-1824(-)